MCTQARLVAVALLSIFTVSFSQTWTGQAAFKDVPWDTNIYEKDVKIIGDVNAIEKLNGQYIQNGPAIWDYTEATEDDDVSVFLGLTMLRSFYFKKGKVSFRARMLNDSLYRMMYDQNLNATMPFNESTVMQPTDVTIRKLNGNTVLANGPSIRGTRIDPSDLSIIESPYIYDDDFYIDLERCFAPPHGQIDPNTNEIFHMYVGTDLDLPMYYQLYHIKPDTNTRILAPNKIKINHAIEKYGYVQHMNGLTEHFFIFCFSPPMVQNLTEVIWKIVDRYSGEIVAEYVSDVFVYFHYVNSYEFIDEVTNQWYIIADVGLTMIPFAEFKNATNVENIRSDPTALGIASKSMHINRFIFPLNDSKIERKIGWKALVNVSGQMMPTFNYEMYNTMPYQYMYALYTSNVYTSSDSVIKIKVPLITTHEQFVAWQKWDAYNLSEPNYWVWKPDPWQNANEPYFVPADPKGKNEAEDNGFVLDIVMNGQTNKTYMLILNATTMETIATANPSLDATNGTLTVGFHARYYQS